ncbi:hypothetical protein [Sphingomonas arenae]|uniref:hypothetical protein n=1 Tax=Sphingomonas arenae TaxID=2812555 RepID=UPI001968715B|nr:hypothetical protein [Sphingomonas arenae]
MLRILAALVGSLAFAILLAMGERLHGPLNRLFRAALAGAVALLVLIGLAVGTAGVANEAWWAAVIGGLLLALAARLGWKLRRSGRERDDAMRRRPGVPSTNLLPDLRWRKLDKCLTWPERQRARLARESIQGFLAERQSPSLTHEHQSLLVSLERRVPELIDTCLERCQRARPDERRAYVDETLGRLVQIAAEAEQARAEVRAADDQRLQVLHRYFDGKTADASRSELPRS